ncbi:Cysteine-rich receptor-like protein kinase 8 [Nymphaea thermarum]|nr:Cysteine-rich receptor-like protein kinase 8 [Nymphaea thermarum]
MIGWETAVIYGHGHRSPLLRHSSFPPTMRLDPQIFVFFFLEALFLSGEAYIDLGCSNNTSNYTSNSTYELNLKTLLLSLPTKAASGGGFYMGTTGDSPDQVYGLALCRGYLSPELCANCTSGGFSKVFEVCPGGRSATLWLDNCLVRYSDANFSGIVNDGYAVQVYNVNNASDVALYNRQWGLLMYNLSATATTANSKRLFADGDITFTDFLKIYGMVQCTRDLSADDCYGCLSNLIGIVGGGVMKGKIGGWVITASCFLGFENWRFYSTSSMSVSPPAAQPTVVSPPPPPSSHEGTSYAPTANKRSKHNKVIVIISVLVPSAMLICIASAFLLWRKRTDRRSGLNNHSDQDGEVESVESFMFDLDCMKAATNNFSNENKLGEGGYGPVYKGTLPDGRTVAVKRLSKHSGQGAREFKNEVRLVVKLQHRNLVRLLGCCLEDGEKILIYEFVPNKSLDKHLFNSSGRVLLDWVKRTNIIVGIARGLVYLHHDSLLKIIHRDLKASNILLDMDMNPKISDFGLAKLVEMDQTHGNASRIAGTYGYMAPEYISEGRFSVKSDVFSFGVLMLEIVTARKNGSAGPSEDARNLLTYAWTLWRKRRAMELIDEAMGQSCETSEALRCIHIGLLCVQQDPANRPTMSSVLLMLSSPSVTLPAPSAPAFFLASNVLSEEIESNDKILKGEEQPLTASDISITSINVR